MDRTNASNQKRHLDWQKCYNIRDLGGLPAGDGQTTRWRSVIRADLLRRLTADGRRALVGYGVKTIIDLRGPEEVAQEPSLSAETQALDLTYLNLPIEAYYPHVSALIEKAETRSEIYCIVLDYYPDLIAAVMRAIAEARPGGIVVHCHAGKDRTGTITALLLSLVGVPDEVITADYAVSQERLWPRYERLVAEAGGEDEVGFWLRPTATAEMMQLTLDHLRARYGGAEGYLKAAGLSPAEIAALKGRIIASGHQ